MNPFIPAGSRLRVRRVPVDEIRDGDVVCYLGEGGRSVAHRVVGRGRSGVAIVLRTRGDAGGGEEQVPGDAVLYVVRRVEHRLFAYDTEGAIGRAIARIALARKPGTRLAKSFCIQAFRVAVFARRAVRGSFEFIGARGAR